MAFIWSHDLTFNALTSVTILAEIVSVYFFVTSICTFTDYFLLLFRAIISKMVFMQKTTAATQFVFFVYFFTFTHFTVDSVRSRSVLG